ncbi:GH92 family glycosyl hydrolase [Ideonella paludis]|uniref:GH92 family glycosyl hydrolase n=1 Tax=Ideonella paludis TaxID=1233411 RepID=A0ABS5E1N7_9BURK|nr:GH92 family glycosyl hydrolase [Ideonella paludis]MBQ0937335.1 GH92 family glycosyl hydrolase [Ideonella paludis]
MALTALSVLSAQAAQAKPGAAATDFTRLVDPFVGTQGTGHTFPGAVLPFGMVAPSPDTNDRGWSYSGGYQHADARIRGFSNTHISGAGIPELGDILLQPHQGQPWTAATTDFSLAKSRASEHARPGYYRVRLPQAQVTVELSATQRVAWHRYTFARGGKVQVLVDGQHGLNFVMGELPDGRQPERVLSVADHALRPEAGEWQLTVHSRNWVERQASAAVRFDHPIHSVIDLPLRPGERAPRQVFTFDLKGGRVLQAKVALSTVDVAGAWANMAADNVASFEAVRQQAQAIWNAHLGRIRLHQAPATQQRIFYTALYHVFIHPSDIADADGRVRGPRGEVLQTRSGHYYSTLSLWDTFRAVHPLFTLIAPERVDGMVQTLLDHHAQQGYLPLWTAWGRETHTMIGNPALPVIADAMAKGFKGFDHRAALQAMVETSTRPRTHAPEWAQRDWTLLDQYGYLPFDKEPGESVSKTLELGYGDDAVARAAALLGDTATQARFAARAKAGYTQLWDASTQVMRGKDSQGRWREPFNPDTPTSPLNNPGDYTEANAWQYTLTPALHDPEGLRRLMGGEQALARWLDAYFSRAAAGDNKHLGQEAMIGQNAHGNEPSHHAAWLYAYSSTPWKGHALVQRIAQSFYREGPRGLIGNDDCGQMSAWLVFATLGLYPVTPGQAHYTLGLPLVRQATLQLGPTQTLTLTAPAEALAPAMRGRAHRLQALLDGRPVAAAERVPHSELVGARTLRFGVAR